jgi:mannosyltransferase
MPIFRRLLSNLRKNPYALCFLAISLSAICKLLLLGSRELWLDETYSAYAASLPFHDLIQFTAGDVHPQLFSIILWGWVRIAGDAQATLRLFSVLVNICSMLAMVNLGRRVLGVRWGGFAAILFAFSPTLLIYSLEVRSYTLFLFVFVCAITVHWIIVVEEKADRNGLLVVYSLLLALLFYIHYLGIFILVALFAHWVLRSTHTRERLPRIGETKFAGFL